ncbi:MAG: PAS domain S-box protein, partial [Nitrospira sp.]|nr:PAS domain S-box protein [Nitrospira sp.]
MNLPENRGWFMLRSSWIALTPMSSLLTPPKGESYFRTLFDACGEAFVVTNEQGQAIDCNDAALDLFSCQRSDILGTTPLDWSPELQPDGRRSAESAAEVFARAAVGETVCFEWENHRLDREPIFISVTVRRAVIEGQMLYLVVSRNISDRKQAEEALRDERRLRDTIQDAIPGIAYAINTKGFFRFWSRSFENVTGRGADELARINALELFEGDDRSYIAERIKEAFARGKSDAEAELVAKDGRRTAYFFTGRRIELGGESILVGAGMDVTARVQAERALREEQDRFRTLFESSPDPVWIIENNAFTECNEAAARILGYPNRNKLLFVHPSALSPEFQPDGESSFAKAERMMEMARKNGINRFEWTHTRANGEDFPAEVTLSSITLQGREIIYCVWRDISERQQAESALRASEVRFRTLFEQAAVGVAQIDTLSGRFLAVNRKYCDIVGYSEAEMLQLDFPSITHPDDLAEDLAKMELLKSGQIRDFDIEKRYVHRDGHLVWVELTASPL